MHVPATLSFTVGDRVLEFRRVDLVVGKSLKTEVFASKNNKTLRQTILHPKYLHLRDVVAASHAAHLDDRLGEFLIKLKKTGNLDYLKFLNKYGDDVYCDFCIDDRSVGKMKGLYCFVAEGQVKYIGKSVDSFGKRISQGYGRIHPKNCFRDGQATNCHLNALIAQARQDVRFFVHSMTDDVEIASVERMLIAKERPLWNIQLV